MSRTLAAVAREVSGRLSGSDAAFGAVTTDTRRLARGALYVALRGERFDGNDFVARAAEGGAAGALVSRLAEVPLPQIEVDDTRIAFGRMARVWRENFAIPVIAVTGSAGKTTVKELIAGIVGRERRICVTEGNLNNDIGVPLTLMRLDEQDAALVIELGANHGGEIAYLAGLVQPTIAVITNAGAAHLEGFGSLRGVAQAKGELLDHLPRAGAAVLNADDRYFGEWRSRSTAGETIAFGTSPAADCRVVGDVELTPGGSRFRMRLPDGTEIETHLPLAGQANVMNALAAAAAAHAAGCDADAIRAGLESAQPVRGRLAACAGRNGAVIIDDSYNANPSAAKAALDHLGKLPGRHVFVLGDMLELGSEGPALHAEVGLYAADRADAFYGFGALAGDAAAAFGTSARHFDDLDALRAAVENELEPGVTVLIKGSRSMGLDRLVAMLAEPEGGPRC